MERSFRGSRRRLGSARVSRVGCGLWPQQSLETIIKPGVDFPALGKVREDVTSSPTRETRALPNPSSRFCEIGLVDFEADKFFHPAAFRRDG